MSENCTTPFARSRDDASTKAYFPFSTSHVMHFRSSLNLSDQFSSLIDHHESHWACFMMLSIWLTFNKWIKNVNALAALLHFNNRALWCSGQLSCLNPCCISFCLDMYYKWMKMSHFKGVEVTWVRLPGRRNRKQQEGQRSNSASSQDWRAEMGLSLVLQFEFMNVWINSSPSCFHQHSSNILGDQRANFV